MRHNETAQPKQAGHITVQMYDPSRASKGIDITAGNFVSKDGADEAEEWDGETEYADYRPTDAHRQPFEQRSNMTIAQHGYASNGDAKPQAPIRSNRAGGIPQIGWQGNDIIDADFVEIPAARQHPAPYTQRRPAEKIRHRRRTAGCLPRKAGRLKFRNTKPQKSPNPDRTSLLRIRAFSVLRNGKTALRNSCGA